MTADSVQYVLSEKKRTCGRSPIPIKVINLNTKQVVVYDSIYIAAQELKINSSAVRRALKRYKERNQVLYPPHLILKEAWEVPNLETSTFELVKNHLELSYYKVTKLSDPTFKSKYYAGTSVLAKLIAKSTTYVCNETRKHPVLTVNGFKVERLSEKPENVKIIANLRIGRPKKAKAVLVRDREGRERTYTKGVPQLAAELEINPQVLYNSIVSNAGKYKDLHLEYVQNTAPAIEVDENLQLRRKYWYKGELDSVTFKVVQIATNRELLLKGVSEVCSFFRITRTSAQRWCNTIVQTGKTLTRLCHEISIYERPKSSLNQQAQ